MTIAVFCLAAMSIYHGRKAPENLNRKSIALGRAAQIFALISLFSMIGWSFTRHR